VTAVLDAVRSHLKKIKPSGNEEVAAICPFHRKPDGSEERGPSFYINVNNGLWFCHSCHSRGNLYTFLRNVGITHFEITEQYKYLLDEVSQHRAAKPDAFNLVAPTKEPLNESLLGLFDYYPEQMREWGFPPELCKRFGVGFDEAHMRITFPLRDYAGRLVGISGRAVTDNIWPRYKIYDKEYELFGLPARETQKRAILWNAHEAIAVLAKETDPAKRRLVIVEGFKAAMRVAQSGISAVVAFIGSYMSFEQQCKLESTEADIYMMLDNNAAGRTGCLDAYEHLLGNTLHISMVEYNADQPSDLTPEEVTTAIAAAKPFAVWFHQRLAPSHN
jgi:DNA primase